MATAQKGIFPKQMDRDIIDMVMDSIQGSYSEYEKVAYQADIPKGKEMRYAEITGLGDVESISEGGRPAFDVPEEGNEAAAEASKYGLGFMITEEMMDDDYHGKIMKVPATLGNAAVDKVNTLFFSLFNDGNDTHTSADGAYIFADAHTTLKSGDTIDNLGAAALSETAFQAAFEYFDDLVDQAGRPTMIEGDHLMVSVSNRWMANRLAKQEGGISTSGTAPDLSGNLMSTNPSNGFVNGWDFGVYKYLTADAPWFFIKKNYEYGPGLYWKKRITTQSADDWQTDTRMYKVTFRAVAKAFDFRCAYGSYA